MGLILGRRGSRLRGVVLSLVGVAAVRFITVIHGNEGSAHGLQAYAYIANGRPKPKFHMSLLTMVTGMLTHPVTLAQSLWHKNVDMWANLGATGFVGLAYLPLLPIVVIVVLANSLFRGILFAEPLFQSLPIYVLMPVATIGTLTWLVQRRRRTTLILTGVIVAQAIGWAAAWTPDTFHQWLRVSDATAATLARIEKRIPSSAQVFVSQGVIGRFSSRTEIRPLPAPRAVPVKKQVWFVVVPFQGIETQSTAQSMEIIGQVTNELHARLITHANGVWAFRWYPPKNVRTVTVPDGTRPPPGVDRRGLGRTTGHGRAAQILAHGIDRRARLHRRPAPMATASWLLQDLGAALQQRPGQPGGLERQRRRAARGQPARDERRPDHHAACHRERCIYRARLR
jgi:hypothetical protein